MAETKRQKYEILRSQLDNERSSFVSHWRDLSDHFYPRRARFFVSDANKGDRRNQKIIDTTPTLAARTLRSGMMGGVTSPARPWFRLTTPSPDLAEIGSVKNWLSHVSQNMSTVFLRSNLYNVLPLVYGDIGVFGTACIFVEEDFDNVIRFTSFPIGSYMIGKDYRGRVNVFIRDFRMTVRQLVEQFGEKDNSGNIDWSNFSDMVKNEYERHQLETWIDVCHIIQPNPEYDDSKAHSKFKKFSSCYYERNSTSAGLGGTDPDKFLREKGYDFFPVLCPRWEVTGEDVYGTECPGMQSLGDNKQLQLGEKRKAQAIEKMVNPPMTGPTSLKNQKASILAGDITFVDTRADQNGFRPAHEVNPRIQELEANQAQIRQRIDKAFYADLFLMLSNMERSGVTAREIDERHEEKLLALGPVLEQLNQDLLDPLIDITFDIMVKRSTDASGNLGDISLVPPPPEELHGLNLKVEYTSVMAQAQKLIGISTVERFANFAARIAEVNPESLDKLDTDQLLDVYGDLTSVPPGIIRTDEAVAELRKDRAKAQKAQQAQQVIQSGASAARDLSQADMSSNNALTALLGQAQAGQLVEQ